MCGIMGAVNIVMEDSLLDTIKHRGPDDRGVERLHVGGARVFLGHRRLAIVDLSPAGHQPMSTVGGGEWLIFNGEIYNHQAIRRELTGVEYRGHSDTETLLHAISQRYVAALPKLNGIFAFAYLNRQTGKLLLVRDPFGIKPLYVWQQGNALAFSSELLPLVKLVGDGVDLDHLAEVLRLRYAPSPDTLFKSIRKVRPGHCLEVDLSGDGLSVREFPFLKLPLHNESLSFEDARNRYGDLLEQAVQRQMMSDVEVGVLLSGGIDSALVAHFAQKHSTAPLKAFTVGFTEGGDADELEDARETARILGMEHHEVRIGFDEFFESLRRCISIVEEPLATTSIIPMDHLAMLAAGQVKVVLSGQGADESLGGYGRYQSELVRGWIPPLGAKWLHKAAQSLGCKHEQLMRGLRSLALGDDVQRFVETYAVFGGADIEKLIGCKDVLASSRVGYFYDLLGCRGKRRSVDRMMAIDLRMNLSDDLLLYTDKITMRHSLECRVPLLDLDLVAFIESLPADYKVRWRQGKFIHKQFAHRILPAAIVQRKKKGFLSPTKTWFRKKEILAGILLNADSRFSRYFDLKEVERVLDLHVQGFNLERQIFILLGLYFWMEDFT